MEKHRLQKDDLVRLVLTMADDILAQAASLGDLDAKIGDGDLGVTLTLGFQAVKATLADTTGLSLQDVLSKCAVAFADNAASTFGTLMATMFMSAAKVLGEQSSIGPREGAEMLRAAASGVQKRGKAELGDKTVLDALIPATQAFEEATRQDTALLECVEAALSEAEQGAERTIRMRARTGRSEWLGERTVGVKDPGAAALVVLLRAATRFIRSEICADRPVEGSEQFGSEYA